MAVQTVFIQMTYEMSQEAAFLMQAQGKREQYAEKVVKEREYGESQLDALLNDGWTLLYADKVRSSSGDVFAFVLRKPDAALAETVNDIPF
jgi:hypothetical protein